MKIELKRISRDKTTFFNINGKLDLNNKKIDFYVTYDDLKKIFGFNLSILYLDDDIISQNTKNIYVEDDKGVFYSCIGCIFSIKSSDVIIFSSESINLIIENTLIDDVDKIAVKSVSFKTYYLGHPKHSLHIKSFNFNYTETKKVNIITKTEDNFIIEILVNSKKESSYNNLSQIIYTILEMIMLIFGDIPKTKSIEIKNVNDEIIKLYFNMSDKYNPTKKSLGLDILGTITDKTINKENIKNFEKFRKKTKIIYDLFMININSDGYKEIKNCNLIQIMEGMYNTLIATNVNLRNILIYYFSNFKTSKKILTKRDKRKSKDPNNTEIFIYKANNHRHYLSHLNLKQNKNVFYGLENIYAYWKLVLSIRVFILEYVGINYNYDYVVKYIKEVDDWAKKQKLRFSARINN